MLYITGDTHTGLHTAKLNTRKFPEQKTMTGQDYVLICGDFGAVWNNDAEDLHLQKWYAQKNFTTLFIDGNHENHALLATYPVVELLGGKAHKINDKLYHLMRGEIFDISGKRVFALGGAASHDRFLRTEGKSWWREELPSEDELAYATEKLKEVGNRVDIIATHCAPTSFQRCLNADYTPDRLTEYLEALTEYVDYQHWYFGHYHEDRDLTPRHTAVFNRVIPIDY